MAKFIRKKKDEVGLGPNELLFRGEQKIDKVLLRVIDFDEDTVDEMQLSDVKKLQTFKQKPSVSWFNVDGLHDIALMREIAENLALDFLVMADVLNIHSRPKVQEYENCIFVSIKMLQHNPETHNVDVENLSVVLTESVLISFQEQKGDVFEPVRERIRKSKKRIRGGRTDYLMFALLDVVIDNYIYIMSLLGDKIEAIDEKILTQSDASIIDEINALKQNLNFLRKNIKPARDMLLALSKLDSEMIEYSTDVHFSELLSNINQVIETTDSYREILSDQLNIYHTNVSSRLNDTMKILTIFSVIFIPLTFIAGIYGTNFDVVPELHYEYSYYIMWGVMLVLAIFMLAYFKIKKWF